MQADQLVVGEQPADIFFVYTDETQFVAETFWLDGRVSDPHLWLYNSDGVLVAANDDYVGLNSYLNVMLPAGSYRLRAGYCCGDPDAVRTGWSYTVDVNAVTVPQYTTTTSTTTTTEPATTTTSTTEPPTTTTELATTTTELTTTTVEATTTSETPTSVAETSTTTSVPITTQPVETSTSAIINTTTQPDITTTSEVVTVKTVSTNANTTTQLPTTTEPTTTTESATTTTQPVTTTTTAVPQIDELVAGIDDLTPAQLDAVIQELNNAPTEIKKQFEDSVNIYSGKFDTYVPSNQTIPVKQRRTLIAVTGSLVALSSTAQNRKNRR